MTTVPEPAPDELAFDVDELPGGDYRVEFALTPKAGRLFGDNVLYFQITPVGDESVDEIIEHVERLLR